MNKKGVRIEEVSKEFKTYGSENVFLAVDRICIDIKPSELVTLLGPSGCGKTTMLRMIAGLETPTSGNIYFGDELVNDLPANKRDSSMVFQSYAIFPHFTVFENIAYGLKIKKMSKEEIETKVNHIIKLVGLENLGQRSPSQLSGGQQQRVALARALVMEPSVLLFDEPLSNLDAKLRVYMRTEIRRIQQELGLTSIYVTHDQSEAMALSDRVIVMNKGKIEQIGTPQEIYQTPANEFVADFIGVANFLDGKIISIANQKIELDLYGHKEIVNASNSNFKEGEEVRVMLRPESICLDENGKYSAKVIYSTFMGNVQDYVLDFHGQELKVQENNPAGKKIYRSGDDVKIAFESQSIHILKKEVNQ